ncbi:hypothetical protein [Pontibacter virosus]|uniref:Uncharacterized protein n=1 Tax=Pontibacter virosus TaxID=1765052 RepID=A0A2U1AVJ7_9BACT|nr:hypothetical protein [Pontibacter virosus]PVY40381.1 hypothetical protein C8E01_10710 [Pontibacter virosus]
MEILHLLGHNANWNLDLHFQNEVGDGFVFCAYSFPDGYFGRDKISGGYKTTTVIDKSFIDLQYYGKKESANLTKSKLTTYSFHPSNVDSGAETNQYLITSIIQGIEYQLKLGFKKIIIPNYCDNENIDAFIGIIKQVNRWLIINKADDVQYFMSIPFSYHTIHNSEKVETVLYHLTDKKIVFDGYYIVCEPKPETRQKLSIETTYLSNITRVLSVLKKQGFKTIYAYANWDTLVFLALTDIDYVTIASFENLRNFSIKRFTVTEGGGPSKGWYFSEAALNMIKAQYMTLLREKGTLDFIENQHNIFSDAVLQENYPWSNTKPEVHKNYMLSVAKLLKKVSSISNIDQRKLFVLNKIDEAISVYEALESRNVYLEDESKNYHLGIWKSFLRSR